MDQWDGREREQEVEEIDDSDKNEERTDRLKTESFDKEEDEDRKNSKTSKTFSECNDSDVNETRDSNTKYNYLNFSLSNARSLAGKIDSLVDIFNEADLNFSMITETWFKNDRDNEQSLKDLKAAENIEFICKNRNTRGGWCRNSL